MLLPSATELVHIGQTAMAGGLGIDYLIDAVFNVPTFVDAYKIAALDAANRLLELEGVAASASQVSSGCEFGEIADAKTTDPPIRWPHEQPVKRREDGDERNDLIGAAPRARIP